MEWCEVTGGAPIGDEAEVGQQRADADAGAAPIRAQLRGGAHGALDRLTSSADFERVRRDGRSHAHPLVVLFACQRDVAAQPEHQVTTTRVGVTAGKVVGGAVKRNRAKRLLREAMRGFAASIPAGWDLVLVARRPLPTARLTDAQAAVGQLLQRARLTDRNQTLAARKSGNA